MINDRIIYISIIFSGLLVVLSALYPEFDIKFSQLFYEYNQGFIYRNNFVVKLFFLAIPATTWVFLIFCNIVIVVQCHKSKEVKKFFCSWLAYLIVAIIIGPGLTVNYVLKNHIGRARPSQITEFGGTKEFTTVITIADQCSRNCSLPSGHAAMAYYYTSLAYVISMSYKKTKRFFTVTYLSAILFGTITGFSRVLMGGHFLSDIILSCFIILVINHLLYLCWRKIRTDQA